MISKNKPLFESQKWDVLFEDHCSGWRGFFGLVCSKYGNCTMSNFYYNYQNPSAFCFLVQIRPVVFLSPSRSDKFEYESKSEMNSGSCSQKTSSWKWPINVGTFLGMSQQHCCFMCMWWNNRPLWLDKSCISSLPRKAAGLLFFFRMTEQDDTH